MSLTSLWSRRSRPRAVADRPAVGDVGVDAVVGPDCVQVAARRLRLGEGCCATFAVTGYPAMLAAACLETILSWPGRLDLAIHVTPIPADQAAGRLRQQRARLESTRRIDADRGRLGDPQVDAAAEDAAELADRIARGAGRLFRTGIYITMHGLTPEALVEACEQVRTLAASMLLDLQPVTHRHLQGWTSTLPLASDTVGMTRTLDTQALAALFPLASPDLPPPLPGDPVDSGAVLYGINIASGGLVMWNRWACQNHNSVVLAPSGAGKSFHIKLETLRSLYLGIQVRVVDPEEEYVAMTRYVGGTVVQLGAPGVKLNPFDIPAGDRRPDGLMRRALFLHTVIGVLAGALHPAETAALDQAILATYHHAGITTDPATWDRPAPLLADLHRILADSAGAAAQNLAARLVPWVSGSFSALFDGPTTTRPDGPMVVWSLRQLPDELRTIGTLLALDTIWRGIDTPAAGRGRHRPRQLIVVDEAWTMLRQPAAALWLFKLAKSARKRNTGLAVVSQDIDDVLGSDLGRAVINNSATQLLMGQSPQTIDLVGDAFHLAAEERNLLLRARPGEALLLSGPHRIPFGVVADPDAEYPLVTTGAAAEPAPTPQQVVVGDDTDLF